MLTAPALQFANSVEVNLCRYCNITISVYSVYRQNDCEQVDIANLSLINSDLTNTLVTPMHLLLLWKADLQQILWFDEINLTWAGEKISNINLRSIRLDPAGAQ